MALCRLAPRISFPVLLSSPGRCAKPTPSRDAERADVGGHQAKGFYIQKGRLAGTRGLFGTGGEERDGGLWRKEDGEMCVINESPCRSPDFLRPLSPEAFDERRRWGPMKIGGCRAKPGSTGGR
ncbi:uncharacterized protein P884DRAFT_254732 [Thermothelomyces heterothallicus CBS 202.75]|uniref:uncharacterized protein n=1 Tax=Thermothelomyces heterothallicus CBS 202.75 TaxID=1149848 RepID=UPI0037445D33